MSGWKAVGEAHRSLRLGQSNSALPRSKVALSSRWPPSGLRSELRSSARCFQQPAPLCSSPSVGSPPRRSGGACCSTAGPPTLYCAHGASSSSNMNPYSGTSTLAKVRRPSGAGARLCRCPGRKSKHDARRASAWGPRGSTRRRRPLAAAVPPSTPPPVAARCCGSQQLALAWCMAR